MVFQRAAHILRDDYGALYKGMGGGLYAIHGQGLEEGGVGRVLTVLAAHHIQILAQILMLQLLQALGTPQNCYRVGRQRKAIAAAYIAWMQFGKERDGA